VPIAVEHWSGKTGDKIRRKNRWRVGKTFDALAA